jgi:hypothetical protein
VNENFIYDAGQRYARDAIQAFEGLSIPEHVRGLIQTHLKVAYIRGCGDVYTELRSVLRSWASEETPLGPLDLLRH